MNHSCRPTCAIEFDYTAQIFVLQQPYNDMDKGTMAAVHADSSVVPQSVPACHPQSHDGHTKGLASDSAKLSVVSLL